MTKGRYFLDVIFRIKAHRSACFVCLLAVVCLTGCESSTNSVNVKVLPDQGTDMKPRECRISSDCEPGYYCSRGAICIYDCREDRDCTAGLTCQSGRCLQPGVPAQGGVASTMMEPRSCSEMQPCGDGFVCTDGLCEDHCERTGCPDGEVCEVGTGQCLSVAACTDDMCPNGQVCETSNGPCGQPDCDDVTCPMGLQCSPDSGRCVEITDDCGGSACPIGTFCDIDRMMCTLLPLDCREMPCPDGFGCRAADNRCIPIPDDCSVEPCPEGFECSEVRNRCVPISDCRTSPCPGGLMCPDAGGVCVPVESCVETGCDENERCNEVTGRCEEAGPPGALGENCDRSTDCASGICTDVSVEGRQSTICVQLCCGERDCPIGFGCRETLGVRFCMPSRIYPAGYSFDARTGQSCGLGGRACQSGECDVAEDRCLGTCCTDTDCGGTACVWRQTSNGLRALCGLPNLIGAGRTGAPCADRIDCASGACIQVPTDISPGQCGDFCCTNAQCPAGFVCGQTIDAVGRQIVSVCVPSANGATPDGGGCVDDNACVSGHCVEGVCRSPCCRDMQCAANHRCLPRPNDDGAFARVCIP